MIISIFFDADPQVVLQRKHELIELKGLIVAVERMSGTRHRAVAETYTGIPGVPDTPHDRLDLLVPMLATFATNIERVDGYDESLPVEGF